MNVKLMGDAMPWLWAEEEGCVEEQVPTWESVEKEMGKVLEK